MACHSAAWASGVVAAKSLTTSEFQRVALVPVGGHGPDRVAVVVEHHHRRPPVVVEHLVLPRPGAADLSGARAPVAVPARQRCVEKGLAIAVGDAHRTRRGAELVLHHRCATVDRQEPLPRRHPVAEALVDAALARRQRRQRLLAPVDVTMDRVHQVAQQTLPSMGDRDRDPRDSCGGYLTVSRKCHLERVGAGDSDDLSLIESDAIAAEVHRRPVCLDVLGVRLVGECPRVGRDHRLELIGSGRADLDHVRSLSDRGSHQLPGSPAG